MIFYYMAFVVIISVSVFFVLSKTQEKQLDVYKYDISDIKKDIDKINDDMEFLYRSLVYDVN